ncbi:MAG: hypothetical protein J1E64_13070 [Acetatifactor sp.]|nr:hypothetical protein [Acetatifactor sp.]
MRITFQNNDTVEAGKAYTERPIGKENDRTQRAVGSYQVNFQTENDKAWTPDGMRKEKGKSLIELQQEAGNIDVGIQQDYMTVMSNTMSEEDYAKLEKEGFHFQNMDPKEAVTIVDKIKAELVRSGQVIEGYTDDLDMETLAAAVGSETLARALADSFRRADVPLTQENIDQVMQAWNMASELNQPSDGTYSYMIDNQMEPEIWNFYLAQSSGAQPSGGSPRYYAEEIQGYYAQSAQSAEGEVSQEEIDRVLEQAGLSVDEKSRQYAAELLEQGLPLTAENLQRYGELQSVAFPVQEEAFAEAAANAVAEGKAPIHANLAHAENIYQKAQRVLEYYLSDADWTDLGDITARKQLEEIRLRMTAEVNVKLLKSRFSIDTAPMEQLLEALRQAEREVADSYFPNDPQAIEKYHNYNATNQIIEELPGMPAQLVGTYSVREVDITLSQFHEEGKALQGTYDRAGESYEALMTEPRRDLGDSIRKAFANVDDILEDLDFELSEDNRRAVRILGYNHMEITPENVERVKAAYGEVRNIIEKMTPASVLKMIRDGVNPLEKSFEELNQYFNDSSRSYEESAESYSRFLYGLERQKEITAQERDAFIGIYRMIHQIERSDGAVVGALVNSQAQMQFSNLLSAVRSSKFKGLDVKVEDTFGTLSELVRKGESITDQITRGFAQEVRETLTEVSYSEESAAEYREEELARIREAAFAEEDVVKLLQKGEIPTNAGNLLAAQALLHGGGEMFKTLRDQMAKGKEEKQLPDRLWEKLDDKEAFKEEYGQAIEELKVLTEGISLEQADSSVDVRDLQLVHKQLTIAGQMASSEEYVIPMYIGEELTQVHLTLEHDSARKGSICIAVDLPDGHVEASLAVKDGTVSGFLVGNTEEEVTKCNRAADIFSVRMEQLDMTVSRLPVVSRESYTASTSANNTRPTTAAEALRGGKDSGPAQAARETDNAELYRISKVFLQAMKEAEVAYEN